MQNADNLKPNSERTPEERKSLAKKAGVASGAARRRKKSLKNTMKMLLDLPVSSYEDAQKLMDMGIDLQTDGNNQTLMLAALLREAADGNVKAVREIRSILGEQLETPLEAKEKRLHAQKLEAELKQMEGDSHGDAVESFLQAAAPSENDVKELFDEEAAD